MTTADPVTAVREFNRFYTGIIGVLAEGLLHTPYSLTEARVIFELAQRDETEVVALRRDLGLDAGYLSRMLARFEADGLVARQQSGADARRQVVRLTGAGRNVFAMLDTRAARDVATLLGRIGEPAQRRLLAAMGTVCQILTAPPDGAGVVLRELAPGDLGWVVQRHGALYATEYGWDSTFEALVARIVADFVERRDPARERGWIAELDGEPVGCVFCVRSELGDDQTAKLRLLLVEPGARGLGVGGRLVDECLAFARGAGYQEITLWTNDVLVQARRLYERTGFTLVEQAPHHSFGHDLVGENWARRLGHQGTERSGVRGQAAGV
jgi:DNA-binding MarR family transcriptional regulator/GNAT superfamily N-acetyltransferase